MNPAKVSRSDQRGMALVMALLVLSAISLISIALLMSVTTERKLSGHQLREDSALDFAEAGIAEATSRIASGDINFGTNPRGTAMIFNANPGNLPGVGADTTALATAQPAGAWLRYTTATKNKDALTVRYKTDFGRTAIYNYDPLKNPPVQTASGMPVYQIISTGKRGQERRTVFTEVTQIPVNLNIKAAIAANVAIKFTGNAVACGYNHRADTNDPAGVDGHVAGLTGCQSAVLATGGLPGMWTTDVINNSGASNSYPTGGDLSGQTGFYSGPWDAIGMTQTEFWQWIGGRSATVPADINGIFYLDNNTTTQDKSGSFSLGGLTGNGFIYVDGDLTLNSTCNYHGLIYVEGDVKFNGNAYICGALIVKGNTQLKANGGCTLVYSHDAIVNNIAKFKGSFMTLAWRELPTPP